MSVLNLAVSWECSKHGGITHFKWVNRTVCEFYLNKTAKNTQKREGLSSSAPAPGIYPTEMHTHVPQKACTKMFFAALVLKVPAGLYSNACGELTSK